MLHGELGEGFIDLILILNKIGGGGSTVSSEAYGHNRDT